MTADPWTLYWQSGHAHSCIATQSKDDVQVIAEFWARIAATLDAESRLLDLATGNGTVPAMLLDANASLLVTGVDRAAIDPLKHVEDSGGLANVEFNGGVDITQLPFESGTFGAVTSQFGIEYAPLDDAAGEAVRVLQPGGRLALLMHHSDSSVVGPAAPRRAEMTALLVADGVVDRLIAYAAGGGTAADLEAAGEAHLSSAIERTGQVTGQVFAGVNQVIELIKGGDRDRARQLATVMQLRLAADRDRLQMLEEAALDDHAVGNLVQTLSDVGVKCDEPAVLRAQSDQSVVIGWTVVGARVA
ncbi:MAG: methyltransferase domain-containing protein [Pseudomonadota bacterium]